MEKTSQEYLIAYLDPLSDVDDPDIYLKRTKDRLYYLKPISRELLQTQLSGPLVNRWFKKLDYILQDYPEIYLQLLRNLVDVIAAAKIAVEETEGLSLYLAFTKKTKFALRQLFNHPHPLCWEFVDYGLMRRKREKDIK